ncbi:MAG: hypothetical protein ACTSV1_02885 [Alphaproteobacteria bacterium]
MTEVPIPEPRTAIDVPCGNAVSRPGGDGVVFVKAERQGPDYIHHYLIQLDPVPSEEMALIYIDPDDLLVDHEVRPVFNLGDSIEMDAPGIGHVFINPKGTYLKVVEDPKSQKMFAFIDITTGDICRRMERKVSHVHMQWRIETVLPSGE